MKVLLSIHQKYINKIISGKKTFELRRRFTNKEVKWLYLYETSPTMKVVGKAKIKKVHKLNIDDLWKLTKNSCGINKKQFYSYFNNLKLGYAIEMENINQYKKNKSLKSFGIKHAPQSFRFVV